MKFDWAGFWIEWTNVLEWLIPTFVTLGFGGALLQRFFFVKGTEHVLIDDLLKQLNELKADTQLYWNVDALVDQKQDLFLSQKIKGNLKAISSDLEHYVSKYVSRWRRKRVRKEYMDLLLDIVDVCTGGDFESKMRTADSRRYLYAVNAVHRFRSAFLRRKM